MKPRKLIIKTNNNKYPIFIGTNLVSNIYNIIRNNSIKFNKCLFIVDKNIPNKQILKIKNSFKKKKIYFKYISANEKNKNQHTVNKILQLLLEKNFSRQDCLITVGGGITGDIGGFAASVYKRGLQFINIATTLLAQVDSSVGGKTGVNTKYGKNLIGSFYQPRLVISDTIFLKSLPFREIVCGYGEILKHSLIFDKKFFQFLNKNVFKILKLDSPYLEKAIYESCKIKKKVVEKDVQEKNVRKILNFGHTFAHSFEASLKYSKKLNHGEAVILGMYTALKFSKKIKLIGNKEFKLIDQHFNNSLLQTNIKKYFSIKDLNRILFFMQKDKKNISNKINLILLRNIGSAIINKNYNINNLRLFLRKELIN